MNADQAQGLRVLARQVRSNAQDTTAVVSQRRRPAITVAVVGPTASVALEAAFALALGLHRSGKRAAVLNAVAASGVVGPAAAHCIDPERLADDAGRRALLLRALADGPVVLSPALGLLYDDTGASELLTDLDELVSVGFVAVSHGGRGALLSAAADQVLDVVETQQTGAGSAYCGVTATAPSRHRQLGGAGLLGLSARVRSAAPDIAVASVPASIRSR